MALSDIALASRALIRIGAAPITSFDDDTAQAEIAAALYPIARDALLSSYAWNFATAQTSLARLDAAPVADYQFAYQLPNDFLRILSAGTGPKSRGLSYRIIEDRLHTDAQSAVITYIFRPAEQNFPAYFDQALILQLAAEFTIPITENTSRSELMYRLATLEYQKARQIDAQQDTPSRIENFNLTDVRF